MSFPPRSRSRRVRAARTTYGVETLEHRVLLAEVLNNPSFSLGAQGWLLGGDFWAGTNLSNARTAPGYAAGGVSPTGAAKNSASGAMSQQITIPSNATSADLRFWYSITSEEAPAATQDFDTLAVRLTGTAGGDVLLTQLSNRQETAGYVQTPAFNLLPWRGQTVNLAFAAATDATLTTVFRIDDVSVDVTASASPPNLVAHSPPGWTGAIVTSTVTGTTTDSATILSNQDVFVDWAQINSGGSPTASPYVASLYVDEILDASWSVGASFPPGVWASVLDHNIGPLPAGQHTLRIVADVNGNVPESNETDNEYSEIITVTQALAITVQSPNGGEAWQAGTTRPITWSVAGDAAGLSYFKVAFSTDGGATFTNIIEDPIPAADRSYAWALPASLNSLQLRVRVRGMNESGAILTSDASDADFSVGPVAPPTVPELRSRPGAAAKLFLDFDGDVTAGWGGWSPGATPAFDRDGDAASFNPAELQWIDNVWQRVSEKFSPFDLDVTTVNPGALADRHAYRVVVGGDGSWYGAGTAGGVAELGGFYNPLASNTGWVFAAPSRFSTAKDIAEAVAHEAGHGFGLDHQKTPGFEYYSPGGTRAPIMGTSYNAERGLWWRTNEFPGQNSTQPPQDDLLILSGPQNAFGYRPDDFAAPQPIGGAGTESSPWQASGVIETLTDADTFLFSIPDATVTFDLDVAPLGPMLNATIELRNATGSTLIASADPSGSLGATLPDVALAAGDYRLVVRGNGSYGDLGQYTLTATLANQQPVVATLAATPNPVHQGTDLTLTALGVSDPDGSVSDVRFYFESNGIDGAQDGKGGDTLVGFDTFGADGWTTTFATHELEVGDYTFYAVATDDQGASGPAAVTAGSVVAPNLPPTIFAFTANPAAVTWDDSISLAVSASDPDGSVASVRFFIENNGTPGLQFGGGGDWERRADSVAPYGIPVYAGDLGPGTHTYYAVATDNLGALSAVVSTTNVVLPDRPPTVDSFTGGPDPIAPGGLLTLDATASDPDNVVVIVEFYRESNGVAGLQYDDLFLDLDVTSPFGITVSTAGLPPGTYTYYATAHDGGMRSLAAATLTNKVGNDPPAIDSFTASPDPVIWDGNVTLAATASDPEGSLSSVRFFQETNGAPGLQLGNEGDLLLLDDATAPYGIQFSAAGLSAGTHAYYAVATDTGGASGAVATTTGVVLPNRLPTVDLFTDTPDPLTAGGTLTLGASASDPDGAPVSVLFYRESNGVAGVQRSGPGADLLVAEDFTSPFAVEVSTAGLAAGDYTYYALAHDGEDAGDVAAQTVHTVRPADLPPAALLSSAPAVNVAGGAGYYFIVTYTDDVGVDYRTLLAGNDTVVTGPGGFSQLATIVNLPTPADRRVWTATYRITAPGGAWDMADSGVYSIALRPNEVADTAGNFAPSAALGNFTVAITDTAGPTATLVSAPAVASPGAIGYFFIVTYSDPSGIDYRSILAGNDTVVTGPGGFSQPATLVNLPTPADRRTWTATYRIPAPGGAWDAADSGTYSIVLRPNEVADTPGNFAAGRVLGNFAVTLTDAVAPTAALVSAPAVNSFGATGYFFTVTYSDNVGIDYRSILAGNDTIVTGPGGYSQLATVVNLPTPADRRAWTATYRIPAPGGAWDAADSGLYTISLRPGEVSDTSGNLAPAGALGSFAVSIAPAVAPAPAGAAAGPTLFSEVLVLPARRDTPGDIPDGVTSDVRS